MMPLDARGLAAATAAVTAEINRYWQDDTVAPGHELVAEKAVRAYLSVASAELLSLRRKVEETTGENAALRTIISECAKALGNGAYIAPTCTVDFMRNLPGEILLEVGDLRRASRALAGDRP